MSMNEAELERVVEALQDLVGTGITGAWQPRRDRVVLGLGDRRLLLVPRGPFARLHTVGGRPRNPPHPFSFQGAVRASLKGPLVALEKHPHDRVVDLRFRTRRLHLRLTGRSGGLWLLEEDRVLAAYDGPAEADLPPLPPAPDPPPRSTPRFTPRPGESWDRAARFWFGAAESAARRHERRTVLRRRLRTRLQRDRRLVRALHRDLEKAEGAEAARRRADALAATLHRVERGQTELEVPDLEDPSITHRVHLDPELSPGDNLSRLYHRARRLDRMGDRVLDHLERVERRLRTLDAALHVVDDADDATLDELEALAPPERRRRATGRDEPWYTWHGPHGSEVLVGRNAAGNRRLSFQVARGDDFWFHLRGRPGAHVVLRVQKAKTPDLDTLLAVAQIVLAHARIPEGAAADVQYTRARHVKSIKGAPDGTVLVHDEKVLHVRRDPGALVGWRRSDQEDLDVEALDQVTRRGDPSPGPGPD
jgi:predicted ribosome quality control (RQC) complex YloA/Tae2 family protein